jgi:hypothetical protein
MMGENGLPGIAVDGIGSRPSREISTDFSSPLSAVYFEDIE